MTTEGGGSDDEVARQLQPHLAGHDVTAPVRDSDVTIDVNNSSSVPGTGRTPATWETFDDDCNAAGDLSTSEGVAWKSRSQPNRDDVQQSEKASVTANGDTASAATAAKPKSDVPVVYHHQSGEVVVVGGSREGGGGGGGGGGARGGGCGGGGGVIQTRYAAERGVHEMDRPLKPGRIKMIKIMSVLAAIFFFPTGIPAVVYAWQIPGQLEEGVLAGNIDRALRSARFSQRLAVLSGVLFVLVTALSLALVQQAKGGHGVDNSYLAHASVHG